MSSPRKFNVRDVRDAARGHWLYVFDDLAPEISGAAKSVGSSRHHPCPKHGGDHGDAFRLYDDARETGGAVCNSCGPMPNGFAVLVWLRGWSLDEAIEKVGVSLGLDVRPAAKTRVTRPEPADVPPAAETESDPAEPQEPNASVRSHEVSLARGRLVQRWNQGAPDPGRISAYLKSRGLSGQVPPTLRFIEALDYYDNTDEGLRSIGRFPAILAMVQHLSLGLVALQRIYLAADGPGKADVPSPKKLTTPIYDGATRGASVRLFPTNDSGVLAITEGIENALAVREATGVPVWSAVSAGGMAAAETFAPPSVTRIELWCDNDVSGAGQKAAVDAASRLSAQGYAVVIVMPPEAGKDWLDVFNSAGPDALRNAQADAKPYMRPAAERPEVVVRTDEKDVADETIAALEAEPELFQRGGMLVHVIRDASAAKGISRPPNSPRIAAVTLPRLRELMSKNIRFIKYQRDDETPKPAHTPQWLVSMVEARGSWAGIRRIENVVECPTLRPDGTILETPGFDESTGLLYAPRGDFRPVPPSPSLAEARSAVDLLFDVVSDFPFQTPAHRSAWLAALLTPLARFAFHGPSPLFLADANAAGVGKGKLIDVIGRIVSGRLMARCQYSDDDAEMRKNITAVAMAGDLTVLLDNVTSTLGGAALDAALTADSWNDRILGKSERTGDLPLYVTWFATANNLALRADTTRRVCHIRLSCQTENPEDRQGFKHADLISHVAAHRPELLQAALTILRAFCVAGRPSQSVRPWGSFEDWSTLIRGAIVWTGQPDPGDTRQELAKVADSQTETLRNLLNGWEAIDPVGSGVTVAEALRRLSAPWDDNEPDELEPLRLAVDALCGGGSRRGTPSAVMLAKKMNSLRDRICDGRMLSYFNDRRNLKHWYVKLVVDIGEQSPASHACTKDTAGDAGDAGDSPATPHKVRTDLHCSTLFGDEPGPPTHQPATPEPHASPASHAVDDSTGTVISREI